MIIRKQTLPDEDPNSTLFGYTKSFATHPVSVNAFQLAEDGVKNYNNTVLFGTGYTVTENVISADWAFVSLNCSASTGVTWRRQSAPERGGMLGPRRAARVDETPVRPALLLFALGSFPS